MIIQQHCSELIWYATLNTVQLLRQLCRPGRGLINVTDHGANEPRLVPGGRVLIVGKSLGGRIDEQDVLLIGVKTQPAIDYGK